MLNHETSKPSPVSSRKLCQTLENHIHVKSTRKQVFEDKFGKISSQIWKNIFYPKTA